MLSDLWNKIYFWNDYGEVCGNLTGEICEKIALNEGINIENAKEKIESELKAVKRVVIEAGRDMSEDNWLEVAQYAKKLFGEKAVLDISIRKAYLGGGRVIIDGNFVENTVVSRYVKWRGV